MSPFFRDELLAPVLHFVSVDWGERGAQREEDCNMREARGSTSFKYTTWILAMQCSWTLTSIRMNYPFHEGKSLPARQENSKLQILSRKEFVHFSGSQRGVETHKNSWMEMEKRCNSSFFGNGKIFGARRRSWPVSSWLGSDSSIFLRIPSRVLLLPVSNRTCWAKSSSCKTYFI